MYELPEHMFDGQTGLHSFTEER